MGLDRGGADSAPRQELLLEEVRVRLHQVGSLGLEGGDAIGADALPLEDLAAQIPDLPTQLLCLLDLHRSLRRQWQSPHEQPRPGKFHQSGLIIAKYTKKSSL